jgi:hypothetical protein
MQKQKQKCLCLLASLSKFNFVSLTSCLQLKIIMCALFSAERTEDASRALSSKRELQARVEQISRDFEDEQEQTFEMRQDMTRQYKGMQEELLSRVRVHYSNNNNLACLTWFQ